MVKKVKWKWDMGCYIAFCPHCGEPAYADSFCEFCGKEYKWKEGRYKPREVVVGEYTVVQTSDKSIYVYKGEDMVMHMSCTKRKSKRQLKKMVNFYKLTTSDEWLNEVRAKKGLKAFECDNGRVYNLPEKHCAFCRNCTDIIYDSNGPYLFTCDIGEGDYETCGMFEADEKGATDERN